MSTNVTDRSVDDQRSRVIAMIGVRSGQPEERLDRITALAQHLFGVSMCAVTLLDHDRQLFASRQGTLPGTQLDWVPREDTFCDRAVRTPDQQLVLEDASTDAEFASNPFVTGEAAVRFYAGQPISIAGGPALGTLCLLDVEPRTFTATERELLHELALAVQQELARSDEMDRAAAVQRSLLPPTPPTAGGWEFADVCVPSRAVGGDFIDWSRRADGCLSLTLADVMGKGIGAGIVAATVRAALRTAGLGLAPGAAVTAAARSLDEDLQRSGSLVTMLHAQLDPVTGEYRWADVGHGLLMFRRADGTVERRPSTGLPMGVLPDETWTEDHTVLRPGDMTLAFSDGLLEIYDGTLDALPEIERVLREVGPEGPRAVVDAFLQIAGDRPLLDDLTINSMQRLT